MYLQKVKHTSYLAKSVIDFSQVEQEFQAVVLPKNAEILQVSLEVTSTTTGTIDVGLNDTKDFFMNDIDLSNAQTSTSNKITSLKENSFITINASAALTSGEAVLRVFYFLPSEILAEF